MCREEKSERVWEIWSLWLAVSKDSHIWYINVVDRFGPTLMPDELVLGSELGFLLVWYDDKEKYEWNGAKRKECLEEANNVNGKW